MGGNCRAIFALDGETAGPFYSAFDREKVQTHFLPFLKDFASLERIMDIKEAEKGIQIRLSGGKSRLWKDKISEASGTV